LRPAHASNITRAETPAILDKIYSSTEGAVEAAKRMEQELPITRWLSAGSGSVVVADLVYFRDSSME